MSARARVTAPATSMRYVRDMTVLIAAYAGLSLICYSGHRLPVLNAAMSALWPVRWLLGPPAALLERLDGFATSYAVGTLVVLTLSTLMLVHRRRRSSTVAPLGVLCAVAWIGWGVYEWLISI